MLTDGRKVFPSDFIKYKCRHPTYKCSDTNCHYGRVNTVGIDKTTTSTLGTKGKRTLVIQRVAEASRITETYDVSQLNLPLHLDELVLIEDSANWILEEDIVELLLDIKPDLTYETSIPGYRAALY